MINKELLFKAAGKIILPAAVCLLLLSTACQPQKMMEAGESSESGESIEASESSESGESSEFAVVDSVDKTVGSTLQESKITQAGGNGNEEGGVMQTKSVQRPGPGQTSNVVVTQKEIDSKGISSFFTAGVIGDSLFRRIYGKSFKENCTVPREDLRYLKVLHYGADGKIYTGELICHKDISDSVLEIFKELYYNQYPIERISLVDDYGADDLVSAADNNSSCFNFRVSAGTSNSLSRHAYGKAIDINPLYNPYVWIDESGGERCDPEKGKKYADRTADFPYKIDENDLCYKLFIKHGFSWGGSWEKDKDYMHFSKE